MRLTVSGDFVSLEAFADKLARAGDEAIPHIAREVATEMENLSAEGFRKQADPYGAKWAPRKSGGGGAILVQTGAMRGSLHSSASGNTASVGYGTGYATYHQNGTSRMVARKLVPDRGKLPPAWVDAIEGVVEDVLDELLSG